MMSVVRSNPCGSTFCLLVKVMSACPKNQVSLLEKSCQFVRKIMSICGKNHVGLWEKSCQFCGKNQVGLWEKFVGLKKSLENTRRYTGKKYRIIYVYLPTASHNVYLTENSSKLKTVLLYCDATLQYI